MYYYNILNWQKCHGLMIVGEYYQEYISWSVDIAYENTKSMWRIEYSKFIKVKRKSCNYLTKWLTRNDVFGNDVEYIEDIIRDVVQTQI